MTEQMTKILIVEDSPEDREVYRRMLSQHQGRHYSMVETDYGADGLEICASERPDCILLDFNLPDMNGLEFLDQLGATAEMETGVVMLTGQGNEAVAVEAMKKGAQDYLTKGRISTETLRLAIDNALEKTRLKRELAAKRAELERSNRELDQYARVVAHDLKTPLHGIVSYLDILQERVEEKLSDDEKRFLDGAMRCALRMDNLIKDVLTYSRLGGASVRMESVRLAPVMERVLENIEQLIDEKKAKVIVATELPSVHGNDSQLGQLFQNLIANGIKFCRDRDPEVRVTAERKPSEWLFSVTDNGIGMDPKDCERVFVAFERLHSASEFPGTGLGLAICKKIVEGHGGVIWAESELGKGSTFYFTLLAPPEG